MCDVSVILVNYKNKKLTENCIKSIKSSQSLLNYEIIVVDNDSQDGSYEYLLSKFPDISVIDSQHNGGFAYGNNVGVRKASGKYLLLLNNDTVIYPGMLDNLYSVSQTNLKIGVVGCRAMDGNDAELPVFHSYESFSRIILQTYIKPILEKMGLQRKVVSSVNRAHYSDDELIYADWITGAALFIRKDLYYKVGGLDENYFMYMEDEDLCRRIKQAGYCVSIAPFMGYRHFCGASTIQSYNLTLEYIKSRLLFFNRYRKSSFGLYKKALFHQIHAVNNSLTKSDIKKMQEELQVFISTELDGLTQNISGVSVGDNVLR